MDAMTTTVPVTLGSVLAGRRVQARLKQTELAERMGITDDRVSNLENDKAPVTVALFVKWCRNCGVEPETVLSQIINEAPDYRAD